jgi:serine/threonine-protein kinase
MIGRTIGKYRIVGQLGRGGAGVVYKAVDETLNRDVAVKMLNPDLANTEVMSRFRAEATILARLNHPQIAHDLRTVPIRERLVDGDGSSFAATLDKLLGDSVRCPQIARRT